MPIDIEKLASNYPSWSEKIFNDPIVRAELDHYNAFVYIGVDNQSMTWKTREPFEWCEENVGKKGVDWNYLALNTWLFKDEESALYFKLTWL